MRSEPGDNATSRYATGIYICSDCGVREAFEGNFWQPNLRTVQRVKRIQDRWIAQKVKS
jgi:ribosomal protein L37AE/L43A